MANKERKYQFTWDTIGSEMALARPSLGPTTRIEVYRLFQFTMRDLIEQKYGTQAADDLFRDAGVMAGLAFYKQFCTEAKNVNSLVKLIQDIFKDFGIGIFRVESFDEEKLECILTVDEDLDCSGLPDIDDVICIYDEGFIAGILQGYTGKTFDVREIDCWCTGARTCRFHAKPIEESAPA